MLRTGAAARVSFSLLIGVYFTTGANPDAGLEAERNRQVGIPDLLCDVCPCCHFFLVGSRYIKLYVVGSGWVDIYTEYTDWRRASASLLTTTYRDGNEQKRSSPRPLVVELLGPG